MVFVIKTLRQINTLKRFLKVTNILKSWVKTFKIVKLSLIMYVDTNTFLFSLYNVFTVSIRTDRPGQTVLTQMRRRRTRRLIRVYTVCFIYSNIIDTLSGSSIDLFQILGQAW